MTTVMKSRSAGRAGPPAARPGRRGRGADPRRRAKRVPRARPRRRQRRRDRRGRPRRQADDLRAISPQGGDFHRGGRADGAAAHRGRRRRPTFDRGRVDDRGAADQLRRPDPESALVDETVALVRAAIAEARRFPDLASSVHRLVRERGDDEIGRLLAELVATGRLPRTPALAPDRLTATAGRFIGLAILPLMMRALFGEPLASLRTKSTRTSGRRSISFSPAADIARKRHLPLAQSASGKRTSS